MKTAKIWTAASISVLMIVTSWANLAFAHADICLVLGGFAHPAECLPGVHHVPLACPIDVYPHYSIVESEYYVVMGLGNQQGLEAGDNGRIGGFPSLFGPFVGKVNLREMTVGQPSGITHIPSASQESILEQAVSSSCGFVGTPGGSAKLGD